MNIQALRAHWFWGIAPVVLALDFSVAMSARGSIDAVVELGLLFDLAVLLPCLYWLCYRRRGRQAIVRAAALGCLGIWLALKWVPEAEQDVLAMVAPLRWVGLAALVYLEAVVLLAVYRTVFRGGSVEQAAASAPPDMPPWVARLLALEARFWLRVWRWLRRLAGRP